MAKVENVLPARPRLGLKKKVRAGHDAVIDSNGRIEH
jgi:hypothetical protein